MAANGRIDLLLVGSDSRSQVGVDERSLRTDSIVLLSIDVSSGKVALFNFPRNLLNAPLENVALPGAFELDRFPGFLGYLWSTAALSPDKFQGAEDLSGEECSRRFECTRGWRALTGTIQLMAGVPLDGLVAFNLNGFVDLIDNLPAAGVWIDVAEPVFDEAYINSDRQRMPVDINAGCQLLGGEMTLAYARSRRQDSDFQRTQRQQQIITQVLRQNSSVEILPRVPALLDVAAANMFTTLAEGDLTKLLELSGDVDREHLYHSTFGPVVIAELGGMDAIAPKVQGIFSEPLPSASPGASADPCPTGALRDGASFSPAWPF